MKKSIYGIFLMILVVFSALSLGLNITVKCSNKIEIQNAKTQELESKSTTFGAWIIIGGDRWDHDKLNWIKYTCNKTFGILRECGYSNDEIYYLFPGWECPNADAYSEKGTVKYAIQNWSVAHVGAGKALGIYMMDHGGVDEFCIPGTPYIDDWINATDLNSYLNTYETKSGNHRIVIVMDTCHSGSFINELSKADRIIVTSTSYMLNAFGTPPFFFEGFWSDVVGGRSIGGAFETAVAHVQALGYGGVQKPWIDDNHDGVGHETGATGNLPNGGDGMDAINTWIKKSQSPFVPVVIKKCPLKFFMPKSPSPIPFWVQIQNTTPIQDVRLRIRPPGWSPPDDEGNIMGEDFNVTYVQLSDFDNDGNYTGIFSTFYGNGEYKMNILCRSVEGCQASGSTSCYINDLGIPPADTTNPTIRIKNPIPNAFVSGLVQIVAEGDDDQVLDRIELYIDGALVNTTVMPSYYPYPLATFDWDTTLAGDQAHTITAKACDKAGNNLSTEIIVNPPTGGIPSFSISIVLIGCILVVTIAYLLKWRKKTFLDLSFFLYLKVK